MESEFGYLLDIFLSLREVFEDHSNIHVHLDVHKRVEERVGDFLPRREN